MFKVHEMPFKAITGIAKEAIERYAIVTIADDGCIKSANAGDYILGVAQQEAKIGQEVTVMVHGISFAKAGVKVKPGNKVEGNAGKVAVASGDSSVVVMVAAEANEMCSILIK